MTCLLFLMMVPLQLLNHHLPQRFLHQHLAGRPGRLHIVVDDRGGGILERLTLPIVETHTVLRDSDPVDFVEQGNWNCDQLYY